MQNLPKVNNDYYNHLGDRWYDDDSDPIAVLRAEQMAKNPWVEKRIKDHFGTSEVKIADIGCGAGFLANYLALNFSEVNGLDASKSSLEVAKKMDETKKVNYTHGDAYKLPYADASMDVVCAMDFLEHVEEPKRVVAECARILKPGGLFFFHTFNRNFLAWLIVIKFMEWFVPKTPKNLHVLHLFIKPKELKLMMLEYELMQKEVVGIGPKINFGFFRSILARKVLPSFSFTVSGNLALGYMGYSELKGVTKS